jgi:hypothetical protein
MTDQFTVRVGERDYGPIDLALLKSWRAEGRLLPESLVWTHGIDGWVPLSSILEVGDEATVLAPSHSEPTPSDEGPTLIVASEGVASPSQPVGAGTAKPLQGAEPTVELWQLGLNEPRYSHAHRGEAAPGVTSSTIPSPNHAAEGPAGHKADSPLAHALAARQTPTLPEREVPHQTSNRSAAPSPVARPVATPSPGHGGPAAFPPASSHRASDERSIASDVAASAAAASSEEAPLVHTPASADADSLGASLPSRPRPIPPVRRPPAPESRLPLGWLLLGGIALILVVGGVFAYSVFLRPILAKRRFIAEIRQKALPDRKLTDTKAGLELALPAGWFLLPADSALVLDPGARARLAHPVAGAFASLQMEEHPRLDITLDAFATRKIDTRRLLRPDVVVKDSSEGSVSGQPSRTVALSWSEEGTPTDGAILVWRDAWRWYTITVWTGAGQGDTPSAMAAALGGGVTNVERLTDRLAAATTSLENEAPELGRSSARLLALDALATGQPVEHLSVGAIREVSRGLFALGPDEVREMTAIYAQVYAPVPDNERARLAAWLAAVRDGRGVPSEETQAMRALLNQGIHSLPDESRTRLVELNSKAVTAALLSSS